MKYGEAGFGKTAMIYSRVGLDCNSIVAVRLGFIIYLVMSIHYDIYLKKCS